MATSVTAALPESPSLFVFSFHHLERKPHHNTKGELLPLGRDEAGDRSRAALRAALKAIAADGITGDEDPLVNAVGIDAREMLRYDYPKNVAWTNFPKIGRATWRTTGTPVRRFVPVDNFKDYCLDTADYPRDAGARTASRMIGAAPLITILIPRFQYSSKNIADVHRFLKLAGNAHVDVLVIEDDGATGTQRCWTSSARHREALVEQRRPTDHFAFNYRFNFMALAGRALSEAMRRFPDECVPAVIPPDRINYQEMATPVGLQVLYKIARLAEANGYDPYPIAARSKLKKQHYWPQLMLSDLMPPDGAEAWLLAVTGFRNFQTFVKERSGTPPEWGELHLSRDDLEDMRRRHPVTAWSGTGKYPPLRLSHDTIHWHSPFGHITHKLDVLGLAVRHDGKTLLTDRGRCFLDMLPAACEDPDALLRWNDPDNLIADRHIPAIDKWFKGLFRKMKKAVRTL